MKSPTTLAPASRQSQAETAESTAALCRENIDLVCQISDNTTRPAFGQIARKVSDAGLPIFAFDTEDLQRDDRIWNRIFDAGGQQQEYADKYMSEMFHHALLAFLFHR